MRFSTAPDTGLDCWGIICARPSLALFTAYDSSLISKPVAQAATLEDCVEFTWAVFKDDSTDLLLKTYLLAL